MAFGGKVDDARDAPGFQQIGQVRGVADVAGNRDDVGQGLLRFKGAAVGRVREGIQIEQPIVGVAAGKVRDEVGADETCAARDQKGAVKGHDHSLRASSQCRGVIP